MKRFLLLAVAALAFVGCNEMFENEGNSSLALSELPTLTAGFEDADTRTYVESNKYLRWHESDLISAFVGDTKNVKYVFDGKTGDTSGEFKPANDENVGSDNIFDKIYAVYPYEVSTAISNDGVIDYFMPDIQTYDADTFGRGANTAVAITESKDDTSLMFKNVGGYIKIRLYGEGTVKSIELRGNNGEKIAGNANITATYGGVPKIAMADDATESIILDCGDGVELSVDAENPMEFWVVVPPMEFSKGITIVATDINNGTFMQNTSKKVVVERNIIQPMAAIEVLEFEIAKPANNKIWYTATEKVEPYRSDVFGATLLSNIYDPTTKKGVLTFDSDVTQIGYEAFYGCDSLTSVTIPDSVTTIGDEAFEYCDRLTSVTIPDSVTTIGECAFGSCEGLTSVTIGDSVTTIGEWAFNYCLSLTSVTIPDSVTTIGSGAFRRCSSLKEFKGKYATDNGRCLVVDNTLIAYANKSGTEYTIPDSVITIGDYAFYRCWNLTSITIPDSVTTIGEEAFSECGSLITIGDSVTTIGERAFCGCDITSITIPDSVTTIGPYAFSGCSSLTSVTIGDSVTTIGYYAFGGCYSLTSVTIPDSVITIGDEAFYDCVSLTSVTIGDSVTTIGDLAFASCDSLASVIIGDSVTTIGYLAFSDCDSLTSVTIPNSVTTIGEKAFYYCDSLTSVTIGDSVTTIGDLAFYDCYSLTSVTIPDSVTTIGYSVFDGCSSLTSVTIGDSVTTIGGSAFEDCYSLTSVTIPDSVTTIGDSAFEDCYSLTSVIIGDSVTTIGGWAFDGCKSLTSVTIPDSVTTIGDGAFRSCDSLTSVYCKPTTPPTIGSIVFDTYPLEAIYVPTASVDTYITADGWCDYADYIVG